MFDRRGIHHGEFGRVSERVQAPYANVPIPPMRETAQTLGGLGALSVPKGGLGGETNEDPIVKQLEEQGDLETIFNGFSLPP